MDFFAQQALARGQSRRLVVLFVVAVACIAASIAVVLMLVLDLGLASAQRAAAGTTLFSRHAAAGGVAAAVTLLVIVIASAFKVARLRGGGAVVARELGGSLVPSDTRDHRLRRLRNVVEEIAIASGVPVPEIYVLEQEPGINAFAAGWSPADAAVAVTAGALEHLDRDELQGVVAHEFSHILNGDMRLNIRLMGLLFGILVIGIAAREVLLRSRGSGRDGAALLLVALGIMIIGYVGLFFGRLIKAGVSRQREFLADASAVQFTRQNQGIAGALKKIAANAEGSQLAAHDGEEISHMLFGDGVGYSRLFATHPPLVERIRRLDRGFDPRELARMARAAGAGGSGGAESAPVSRLAGVAADVVPPLPRADARVKLSPGAVARQVGNPGADDFRSAAAIAAAIPDDLRDLAHAAEHAVPLVLALAVDGAPGTADAQLTRVEAVFDIALAEEARALRGRVADLHPLQRLPLAAMAFPLLRRRPRPWLLRFAVLLEELARLDGVVQLPEYCLLRMVRTQVEDAMDPPQGGRVGRRRAAEVKAEVGTLLAVLARSGNPDGEAARRAYLAGILQVFPTGAPGYAPPAAWAEALDRVWPALDRLNPASKALLVEGLARTVTHDGRCALSEAELLRTVCAALHCPLPPQLAA
ncbi:MAG: M48 family metalloprotease [Pseudomonadota bacterium]